MEAHHNIATDIDAKPAKKSRAKKTTEAKPAAPTPSPILNVSPTATPNAVEATYQNYVAKVKATRTARTNAVQKASSNEIAKLHRANEEPRKELKKGKARDLQLAQENYTEAKRAAQGAYDSAVHMITSAHNSAVAKMHHDFNTVSEPIAETLKADLAKIDAEASEAMAAATAEYTAEMSAAHERVKAAALEPRTLGDTVLNNGSATP